MYELLLAEHSDAVIETVLANLNEKWKITVCRDGHTAVAMLRKSCPDALVIDVHLPGKGAASVLQECFPELPSLIIAVGQNTNRVLELHLSRWGADYVLQLPENLVEFARIVKDPEIFRKMAVKRAVEHLRCLGFRAGLNGYYYLLLGITRKYEDPTLQLHGEIYDYISQITHAKEEGIERAIRNAIDAAWKNRSDAVWAGYFALNGKEGPKCPNISDFISSVANRMR